MNSSVKRVKYACYTSGLSMSVIGNLSPLLFITFRSLYGISYSLLGLLVLVNFFTQLLIDLVFSFFSHRFNIVLVIKIMPLLSIAGFFVYAVFPWVFPSAVYVGLVIGTVIFSASGGLAEVLMSPVIAALPSDNPEREMSKLHSFYAWGVVGVILVSTLFLLTFGKESWQILALIWTVIPAISFLLFSHAQIPDLQKDENKQSVTGLLKSKSLLLCIAAIFLGGSAECTMAQWGSGYLEKALGIEKVWGDIFGVAMFALTLGLMRTLYAKHGKNIEKTLFLSAVCATVCYFVAAVSRVSAVGLIACAVTGFCTAMLWPGCLVVAEKRIKNGGVFLYAIMAAGGDLGASVGPQIIGIITDTVSASEGAISLSSTLGISAEQLGMKLGMAVGMLFPLAAIFVFLRILRTKSRYEEK